MPEKVPEKTVVFKTINPMQALLQHRKAAFTGIKNCPSPLFMIKNMNTFGALLKRRDGTEKNRPSRDPFKNVP
jgi:hypothetical protein